MAQSQQTAALSKAAITTNQPGSISLSRGHCAKTSLSVGASRNSESPATANTATRRASCALERGARPGAPLDSGITRAQPLELAVMRLQLWSDS